MPSSPFLSEGASGTLRRASARGATSCQQRLRLRRPSGLLPRVLPLGGARPSGSMGQQPARPVVRVLVIRRSLREGGGYVNRIPPPLHGEGGGGGRAASPTPAATGELELLVSCAAASAAALAAWLPHLRGMATRSPRPALAAAAQMAPGVALDLVDFVDEAPRQLEAPNSLVAQRSAKLEARLAERLGKVQRLTWGGTRTLARPWREMTRRLSAASSHEDGLRANPTTISAVRPHLACLASDLCAHHRVRILTILVECRHRRTNWKASLPQHRPVLGIGRSQVRLLFMVWPYNT